MDVNVFGWLVAAGSVGLLSSAILHATIAAFEQIPYSKEVELAAERRPDGRRTIGAWLAADPARTLNSASVAYAIAETVAQVCWAFIAQWIGGQLQLSWVWIATGAVAVGAFFAIVVVRALPRQVGRSYPLGTIKVAGPLAALLIVASAPVRAVVPSLRVAPLAEAEDLVAQAQDALEDEDAQLLRSVVNLGETLTREVMVPRTDMVTLHSGAGGDAAMRLHLRSGFSRIPVVGSGSDDLLGVVYLKDLLERAWEDKRKLRRPVDEYMREPVWVPESLPVDDLLRTLQREATHLAVVIDEFGGVAGLVTIEDALEEIVGELVDEHDATEPEPIALEGGGYLVPARYPLGDLAELFDVVIDDEDVETAAGLLIKALGVVPVAGSSATAHGLRLTAERTQGRRRRLAWVSVEREEADDA